jgi:hypothetical protein
MKIHKNNWQTLLVTSFIIFCLLMIGSLNSAQAGAIKKERLYGKTFGEWSKNWWQWAFSIADIPEGTHPINVAEGPVDCSLGQQGKVWFLSGTGNGVPVDFTGVIPIQSAERSCDIPRGKALFFPLVNSCFINEAGENYSIEEKRAILDEFTSQSAGCQLEVTLNGEPLYTVNKVHTQSPPFRIEGIEGNFFEIPTGLVDEEVVSDGFWVMLPPLRPGQYELIFKGSFCNRIESSSEEVPFTLEPWFTTEVTYHLTILP